MREDHAFKIYKIDFSTQWKNTQYFIKTHISEGRVLRNEFPSFKIKLVERGFILLRLGSQDSSSTFQRT